MPSPSRIYFDFSDAELTVERAALKAELAGGTIVSLSGAAKSSSFQKMPIEDRMRAMRLELQARGEIDPRASTVYQDLSEYP